MKRKLITACLLACALLVGCGKDTTDEPVRDQGQAIGGETAVGEEAVCGIRNGGVGGLQ